MFLSPVSMVIMMVGSIFCGICILLLLAGKKYDSMLEPLDNKEFPLCEIYGLGFMLIDITKHKFTSRAERKRRQQIALLYGDKFSEYYLRVNGAERFTLASVLMAAGFILYGIAADITMLVVCFVFAALAYYYVSTIPETRLNKKAEAILNDFADVVSKLALLVNAGMILREAWEKIAYTGESELYREMQIVVSDINNGVSEIDAYTNFGMRCTSQEIKKFTSTVVQGMVKGNSELVEMIKQQSREIWDAKRQRTRIQGEKAASKLLIPICIMFIGVLIMIIVPIFANLGV